MSTAAESKKTNSIDMLHGPLAKKIVLFSIPLAITSILQQLLNSTDAVFAGQWLGGDALAAVGGVAPIISLFVAVFVGLSVGVNVVIAVHIGHDDIDKIKGAVYRPQPPPQWFVRLFWLLPVFFQPILFLLQ